MVCIAKTDAGTLPPATYLSVCIILHITNIDGALPQLDRVKAGSDPDIA
jgi:hypothetical protein